mgnify:CR=1 FL=1
MDELNIMQIVAENARRRTLLEGGTFNPASGEGCGGNRRWTEAFDQRFFLPEAMLADAKYALTLKNRTAFERLRCHYDFAFWAWRCVRVRDKLTGRDVPFVLNAPQRRVLALFEQQRLSRQPIRAILLKARQWGGSTLVQMYMAWIQTVHCENWHSLICAHVKDSAANIRGMYTKLLDCYPEELWEGDEKPCFRPFERSMNTRLIAGRGCRVTIGSSEAQEASRGADLAMAHLSEVAFWKETRLRSPEDLIRAVCSGIALSELTFIVLESTANGVGSYFHNEWLRAEGGLSDKMALFVPWHEIEIYRMEVTDAEALWQSLTEYERGLWRDGLTLEQIAWYHRKSLEYPDHRRMMAEYPTTPVEAFSCSGFGVFEAADVERLRAGCALPPQRGQLAGETLKQLAPAPEAERFVEAADGALQVWARPRRGENYLVAVDVGGRSDSSDWSVIAVFRRSAKPEVVAQWRGHGDHDLLAWRAAHIAHWYNGALLVIESNTLETHSNVGEPSVLLHEIGSVYANVYRRRSADPAGRPEGSTMRVGFHTNAKTKALIISNLIGLVRDGGYIERDPEACNEMVNYRQLPNGNYAAAGSHHDDILMTRAIALFTLAETSPASSSPARLPFCPD